MNKKERIVSSFQLYGNIVILILEIFAFGLLFIQTCYEPGHGRAYPYVLDEFVKFYALIGIFAFVVSILSIVHVVKERYEIKTKMKVSLPIMQIMVVVSYLFVFGFRLFIIKDFEDPDKLADVLNVPNVFAYYILPIVILGIYIFFNSKPKLKVGYWFFGGIPLIAYGLLYLVLYKLGAWKDFYNILSCRIFGDASKFNVGIIFVILFGSTGVGVLLSWIRNLMINAWKEKVVIEEEVEKKDLSWVCPRCGEKENTGHFCIRCGEPKGKLIEESFDGEEWTCPRCGNTNKTKYCGNCGTKKPNSISHNN